MARELAILVTARNMASGVLKDVKGDIKGIQSEAKRAASNTTRNLGIAGVAAAGVIATQVKAGLDSLQELQVMQAQTAAVLKSTGNAAGVSAEQVRALAEQYENLTTVDDKAIQNAENLLLTFTKVDKKAFEPALQTILDMNAAMGGDDESLKNVAIQVGKALNDPITGATALRRVGVSLTKQQQEQIKTLVKQNDLYGAQQIVLKELATEFGGSAAAQADTFEGKMRRVGDAVEGAQMALATAFLPVLEKVADKMQTFLNDPKTLKGIEDFGGELADGFETALGIVEKIPWDAVGNTFSIMGQGAKAVLSAFSSLPPWIQTAVLTGWGLNKLTGGALGNIVGALGSGLIKGVLGMNAGVVNINAATVNGGIGGVGGVGAGGGGKGGGLVGKAGKFVLGPIGAALVGAEIAAQINAPVIQPAQSFEHAQFTANIEKGDMQTLVRQLAVLKEARDTSTNKDFGKNIAIGLSYLPGIGDALGHLGPDLDQQIADTQKKIDQLKASGIANRHSLVTTFDRGSAEASRAAVQQRVSMDRVGSRIGLVEGATRDVASATRAVTPALDRIRGIEAGQTGYLNTIAGKNFAPHVTVNTLTQISIRNLANNLQTNTFTTVTGRAGGALL